MDDVKASVTPDPALDKADVLDPRTELAKALVSLLQMRVKYNAAPITSGMPRKTGIDWVSFLYGAEGPSRGSG